MPCILTSCATARSCKSCRAQRSVHFGIVQQRVPQGFAPVEERSRRHSSVACRAVSPEFKKAVDTFVQENKILAFIKGSKDFPQCGFSNTVVQVLTQLEVPFETVDVLSNDMLRSGMKEYSQWPTFPQVYIGGEFYGGCDILLEAYQDGSLREEIERVMLE